MVVLVQCVHTYEGIEGVSLLGVEVNVEVVEVIDNFEVMVEAVEDNTFVSVSSLREAGVECTYLQLLLVEEEVEAF